jgi:hypothetical protein
MQVVFYTEVTQNELLTRIRFSTVEKEEQCRKSVNYWRKFLLAQRISNLMNWLLWSKRLDLPCHESTEVTIFSPILESLKLLTCKTRKGKRFPIRFASFSY